MITKTKGHQKIESLESFIPNRDNTSMFKVHLDGVLTVLNMSWFCVDQLSVKSFLSFKWDKDLYIIFYRTDL